MPKSKSAFEIELAKQKKEHPTVPAKYIRIISRDHTNLKEKGKRNYG